MKLGLFMMPSHPPERDIYDSHQWDLDYLELADRLGYDEAWIGEHFTAPWEPIPAPDLMIAQALQRTRNIKLGSGVHLLPYHHPAELAHRIAYLDHIAQGRFMFGIGSSGLPSDWALFDVDGNNGQHREMTRESLDIILKIWQSQGPFEYQGKFWNVNVPDTMYDVLRYFLTPYQKPHPPIAVASASYRSPTLVIAGERGFIPMSLALNTDYCRSHWEAIEEGARKAGRNPLKEGMAAGPGRVRGGHRRGGPGSGSWRHDRQGLEGLPASNLQGIQPPPRIQGRPRGSRRRRYTGIHGGPHVADRFARYCRRQDSQAV